MFSTHLGSLHHHNPTRRPNSRDHRSPNVPNRPPQNVHPDPRPTVLHHPLHLRVMALLYESSRPTSDDEESGGGFPEGTGVADGGVQWSWRVGVREVDAREGITEGGGGGIGLCIGVGSRRGGGGGGRGGGGGVFGPDNVIGCFRVETRLGCLSTVDRTLKAGNYLNKGQGGSAINLANKIDDDIPTSRRRAVQAQSDRSHPPYPWNVPAAVVRNPL